VFVSVCQLCIVHLCGYFLQMHCTVKCIWKPIDYDKEKISRRNKGAREKKRKDVCCEPLFSVDTPISLSLVLSCFLISFGQYAHFVRLFFVDYVVSLTLDVTRTVT
jgi:hypothetical protein